MTIPLASAAGVIVGVVVVVAIGAAVAAYLMRRRSGAQAPGRLTAANQAATRRGSARGLEVGDVVNYDDADYLVEGTLHFDQDGFRWEEHLLVDGQTRRWLSVEDDEGLELVFWEKVIEPGLDPSETRVEHDGTTYVLEERGHANYTAEGTTGTATGGRCEFADYSAGDLRLSFERYGSDAGWELARGRVIGEVALDIYPAGERGAGATAP